MREAKLFVVDFAKVERKVQFMAALTGSTVLSASVLLGRGGVKLSYRPGHQIEAAVFVTNAFKAEEPAMTVLLREACRRGWTAVTKEGLKGRGRKPSLLLRGEGEIIDGFGRTRVKCLTANEFLRWFTTVCLHKEASGRVQTRS